MLKERDSGLWQPAAPRTGLKCNSLSGLRWLGWEKPTERCVDTSSVRWWPVAVSRSHMEESSDGSLPIGSQRWVSKVEGQALNQAGMRWKRNVHVAGMRASTGKRNALVAEGHSGMRANEQKLSGSSGLVTGWRPQVAGGQEEEEVRKPTWTWRE